MQDESVFSVLCGNVQTSMITLNNTLHEFFAFKDELLKHSLPPQLLVNLTLISSRLFRSYSDLCTPVGEMVRLTKLHSGSWEEKAVNMKKVRADYQNMQRRLNIATKRIEMMSAEEERIKHVRRLNNWERLFCKVMGARSHGRRWKFRIEPLKKKLEQQGFNPYLSDSSSDESGGEEGLEQLSPLDGSEEELKSLSSDSDAENDDTMPHKRDSGQYKKRQRVRFGGGDDDADIPERTASPIVLPVDAATSTDELEYDK